MLHLQINVPSILYHLITSNNEIFKLTQIFLLSWSITSKHWSLQSTIRTALNTCHNLLYRRRNWALHTVGAWFLITFGTFLQSYTLFWDSDALWVSHPLNSSGNWLSILLEMIQLQKIAVAKATTQSNPKFKKMFISHSWKALVKNRVPSKENNC